MYVLAHFQLSLTEKTQYRCLSVIPYVKHSFEARKYPEANSVMAAQGWGAERSTQLTFRTKINSQSERILDYRKIYHEQCIHSSKHSWTTACGRLDCIASQGSTFKPSSSSESFRFPYMEVFCKWQSDVQDSGSASKNHIVSLCWSDGIKILCICTRANICVYSVCFFSERCFQKEIKPVIVFKLHQLEWFIFIL